jgi:hypothetical protein
MTAARKRLRVPSPALVSSVVALFVALGGTGYAALRLPRNSVGAKQLKKNSVTAQKIASGAVTAAKINTAGLTVPNAVHATAADSATKAAEAVTAANATNATNATNASLLGGNTANDFLRVGNGLIAFSKLQGWVMQHGDSGSVDTYSNAQVLDTTAGSSDYYFPLDSLNTLGARQFYLYTVVICYDADAGSAITRTRIDRVNNGTTQTVMVDDATPRAVTYPGSACYTEVVNDHVQIENNTDTYYVDLTTTGTTTRVFRVTAGYEPF